MSDLISRADAIEAVCRTRCGDKAKGCPAHSCLVIEEFDALPSAKYITEKPNDAVKASNDVINRSDAIDAVHEYFKDRMGKSKCDYDEELQVYVLGKEERTMLTYNKGINDKLRSLPSADAEKPCKTCGYYNLECPKDCEYQSADAVQGFRGGKIPPKEMLDGTVLIPKHQWLEMERALAELKEKFESADAVSGYTEWLEKIIVDNEGANEWLCEYTPDLEWCEKNCHYSSLQAECLRHLYEVSKGGDSE